MNRQIHNAQPARGKLTPAGSFCGLAVLLVYLLIPLIYYYHFEPPSLTASGLASGVGINLIANNPEELPSPVRHDQDTCPICKAAASLLEYLSMPAIPAPDGVFLLGLISLSVSRKVFANFARLVADPRAPPTF